MNARFAGLVFDGEMSIEGGGSEAVSGLPDVQPGVVYRVTHRAGCVGDSVRAGGYYTRSRREAEKILEQAWAEVRGGIRGYQDLTIESGDWTWMLDEVRWPSYDGRLYGATCGEDRRRGR